MLESRRFRLATLQKEKEEQRNSTRSASNDHILSSVFPHYLRDVRSQIHIILPTP